MWAKSPSPTLLYKRQVLLPLCPQPAGCAALTPLPRGETPPRGTTYPARCPRTSQPRAEALVPHSETAGSLPKD